MCRFPPTRRQGLEHHLAPHLAQLGKSVPSLPQVQHWITCEHNLECRSRLARIGWRSDATLGRDDDDDVGEGSGARERRVISGDGNSSESESFLQEVEDGTLSKAKVTFLRFFCKGRWVVNDG